MRKLLFIYVAFLLLPAACSDEQVAPAQAVVRPVKTLLIPDLEASGIRTFPARVESRRRAEVSFSVPGTIKEIPVKEGQLVEQGQVIAKLDATNYQLTVEAQEAEYTRTKKDYERTTPLIEEGFVTQKEVDRREAAMKKALAALNKARKDLEDTTLKAPFSGVIAKRLVQNFEEVQAKQPILEMRGVSELEVKFDLPESIMLRVTEQASDTGEARLEPDVFAQFDTAPDKKFKLTFREISTKADPATRTFEATFSLKAPSDLTILPGMTANVSLDLTQYMDVKAGIYVPVEAIVSSNELSARAWVVDEASMTVSPKDVKVGTMSGSSILVLEGLKPGDRIVVAGVPFLAEGMKVKLLPEEEQAEEREDDLRIRRNAEKQLRISDKEIQESTGK